MATANMKKKLGLGDKYHRSIKVGGPESASIEIPPFRPFYDVIKIFKNFWIAPKFFFLLYNTEKTE